MNIEDIDADDRKDSQPQSGSDIRDESLPNCPVIYSYTRAQAIEDGVLVDITAASRELGYKYPVACTSTLWGQYIVPDESLVGGGQSTAGRLHDTLWMLLQAIRRAGDGDMLEFDVIFLMPPGKHMTVRLKSICGPGDSAEPVITIMLPDED